MKGKVILGFLLLSLITCAGAEFTEASTPAIKDTYTIDGITYYNVNSPNFNSDKKFFVDMISAKHSALGGRSLGDLWLITAAGAFQRPYRDLAKRVLLDGQLPTNMLPVFQCSYSAPTWSNENGGYVETSVYVHDIFDTVNDKYTVRFSDFTVGALLPMDEGLYVSATTETGSVKNIEASSVKNDTREIVTASQHVSQSTEETLESSVNHSSSYSFKEGLKVGFEYGFSALFKMTGEISTEFTQAFEDGWSKSEAHSKSYEKGSDVSVNLPPYTTVLIKQGDAQTTTTTNYNCPVILGYKVTLIYSITSWQLPAIMYTFGASNSNARKDLSHRAFDEGAKNLDEQKINWVTVLADNEVKDAITKITKNVPMSASGAKVVYTTKTTYSEVAGMAPLYPLASVQLGEPKVSFINSNNIANMKVGNYSYTNYLPINGYNSRNAEYYGFDASKGRWIVVDENQQEFSGSNAPVVLEKEASTGLTKYRAVKPGKCYLKYLINEDAYPTGIGSNTYTKNANIQTAMLEINVLDEEVTYSITGSYTGIVDSEPESLEGDGKLTVAAYDAEDIEVERSYIWQKRELKGISLTSDGIVSFTKPGNYHVRVKDQGGSIYSDWFQITAEVFGDDYVAPDDTVERTDIAGWDTIFVISGRYVGGLSNDRESIEGSGKLSVAAYDSTGIEQAVLYSWEAGEGSDGMTLDSEGNVSFTKTGTYYVRVKSGSVYSDWIEITANEKAPARLLKVPTATNNSYTGASVDLLAEGGKSEGGVSIVYALGQDSTTAPEVEYTSERPTATEAGTYYVWVKVIGDEKHSNSEPVCVTAEIFSAGQDNSGDGSDTGGDEEQAITGNPGSSGGSCNAGVSVLGLGILLLLRRKAR